MTLPDTNSGSHLTKSDLLLAGWHEIYQGEQDVSYWAHPDVDGSWNIRLAKAMQALWNKRAEKSK